jgi:hypothetical protein
VNLLLVEMRHRRSVAVDEEYARDGDSVLG